MTNQARLWPEGEVFTRKVLIPTNYDPLPVEVVYVVPPFEVVVALWQNKEHEKTYPLFRQFIQGWSLEEKLTDNVLKAFLAAYSGTADAIFYGWSEYMKSALAENEHLLAVQSQTIN
ncbi:TPA: phage tail assembly chaperone [Raoultella ornithinolytica]